MSNLESITKESALAAFNNDTQALANALDISRSAIYQWKDGAPIPPKQALRLRYELRPEWFAGEASNG